MKKTIAPLLLISLLIACSPGTESTEAFYTMDDFKKVKKIDTHVHIRTENENFVNSAKANNFQLVTIVVDSRSSWDWVKSSYDFMVLQTKKNPETVQFATSIAMEGWDDEGWLENSLSWIDSSLDDGAIGIKFWKNIGMVYRDKDSALVMLDDPGFDPIFDMLEAKDIPVVGHLAEPYNCWLPVEEMTTKNDSGYFSRNPQYHMYKHPEMPSHADQMLARDNRLAKNPNLRFIGAHMASLEYDVDELAMRFDRFPNITVDLAARMGQVFYQTANNYDKVRDFFIKYQDRLIYATDLGDSGSQSAEEVNAENAEVWMRDWKFFVTDDTMTSDLIDQEFKGLKLPKEVVAKLFHDNAVRAFKIFE
ncbi:MAG: amidohydrolase family protein [Bacteroidota bacterium]